MGIRPLFRIPAFFWLLPRGGGAKDWGADSSYVLYYPYNEKENLIRENEKIAEVLANKFNKDFSKIDESQYRSGADVLELVREMKDYEDFKNSIKNLAFQGMENVVVFKAEIWKLPSNWKPVKQIRAYYPQGIYLWEK